VHQDSKEENIMKIKCKYDKLVKISELTTLKHPRNYNQHGTEQIELYAEIIKDQGIRRPIRISNFSGFITAGHGLLKAAEKLDYNELPVEYQDYDSEEQELADILADNNLARLATVNRQKRDSIIHELVEKGVDPKITGISKVIMDDILGNVQKIDLTASEFFNNREGFIDDESSDLDEFESQDMMDMSSGKIRELENSKKRPIAIVLDRSQYEKWESLKKTKFKVKGDTLAILKIIEYFETLLEEDKK